MATRKTKAL